MKRYTVALCPLVLMVCSLISCESLSVHSESDAESFQHNNARDDLPKWYLRDVLEESVQTIYSIAYGTNETTTGIGTAWWLGEDAGWVSAYHIFSRGGMPPVHVEYSLGVIVQGELTVMHVTGCGRSKHNRREDWITFQTPLLAPPEYSLSYNPHLELFPGETIYLVGRPAGEALSEMEGVTPKQFAFPLIVVKTTVHTEQPRSGDFVRLQCAGTGRLAGFSGGPAVVLRDGVPIVVGIYTHLKWRLQWSKPVQYTHYVLRKRFP